MVYSLQFLKDDNNNNNLKKKEKKTPVRGRRALSTVDDTFRFTWWMRSDLLWDLNPRPTMLYHPVPARFAAALTLITGQPWLMRRWEVHPHRWILFLPTTVNSYYRLSAFSFFFLAVCLWRPNSLSGTWWDLHRPRRVKMWLTTKTLPQDVCVWSRVRISPFPGKIASLSSPPDV